MEFRIIKATKDDIPAIFQILQFWNMHHIPSAEMKELDLSTTFVAKVNEKTIGLAGYKILSKEEGKTTLLAIHPKYQGLKIGFALQEARLKAMYDKGIKRVTTNADRPEIIIWYKKHFFYREIGKLKKKCSFGLENVDEWTTLQMDLEKYFHTKKEIEEEKKAYIFENDPHPLKPYEPLIINVALTGNIPTKEINPHLPITPEEIAQDALKVAQLGASIVHIHARDEKGNPTYKAKYYEKIIQLIRKENNELIICVSTSGRNFKEFEQRAEVLHLTGDAKPDMASLSLGSFNFINQPSINSIEMIERLAYLMKEKNIKPEMEIFDLGMVNLAKYLERHRIIEGKKYFNILLGNLNTASADIGTLHAIVSSLPKNSIWAVAGIGVFQLPMNTAAILAGGHIRIGLEDNIYYDSDKKIITSNSVLVQRIRRIAQELQRKIASPFHTRMELDL